MRTCLYEKHLALGAKMGEFCGWEVPIHYPKGTLYEHLNVRKKVGLFDVSQMGRIAVKGEDAEQLLDYLSTQQISGKKEGSVTYTPWSNQTGGTVDDVLIFREDQENFFVVVNAANRQKDLKHLQEMATDQNVMIEPCYDKEGIIAVQGPQSVELLSHFFPETTRLKYMRFVRLHYQGESFILSRTGYTGSVGFEIYASQPFIVALWDELLLAGSAYGIEPVGLGARDTLRLEMGYALYGHELLDTIAPSESVAAWAVKWTKPDFLGKEALQVLESNSHKRHQYGVILKGKGVPRAGYLVLKGEQVIGSVTSGNFSPSLNEAIAIVMVQTELQKDEEVFLEIRQQLVPAVVANLPFVPIECKQIEGVVRDRQIWLSGSKKVYLSGSFFKEAKTLLDLLEHQDFDVLSSVSMESLDEAAYFIAECTEDNIHLGREIEYARVKGLFGKMPAKVLCLYDAHKNSPLGILEMKEYSNVKIASYKNRDEMTALISQFLGGKL